ncbi:MAG: dTDP-4-dehydrorhamnose reductase [Wenzhouxiangella sp.]|nr:MAG: dTDP-4-dehydrorhamnose reductase [Wenzhouxiangella sp.]
MRVLLTGAAGQLGRHLRALVPEDVQLITSARRSGDRPCDLLDQRDLLGMLDALRPDAIINAAAWTAVDGAEDEPELALRLNRDVPACLAAWCSDHDSVLLTYSTDYVFSGRPGRAWHEDDPTAPDSVYGHSKLSGELAVAETGVRALLVRTAWVYSALPGNFLSAILGRAGKGEDLRVVADQVGSPTWAGELARASWHLLGHCASELQRTERVHIAGRGAMSWHEFASLAVEQAVVAGVLKKAVNVVPIASADWPQKARRPAWSVLDCTRYEQWTGDELMDIEQALDRCLAQWAQPPC